MKRVLLIHTGGTLGMRGRRPHALRPGEFFKTLEASRARAVRAASPKSTLELFSNVDSSEMQPESTGARLATGVLPARLPKFDGVVITHGTDIASRGPRQRPVASCAARRSRKPTGGADRRAAAARRAPQRRPVEPHRRRHRCASRAPRSDRLLRLAPLPRQPRAQGELGRVRRLRQPQLRAAGRARRRDRAFEPRA